MNGQEEKYCTWCKILCIALGAQSLHRHMPRRSSSNLTYTSLFYFLFYAFSMIMKAGQKFCSLKYKNYTLNFNIVLDLTGADEVESDRKPIMRTVRISTSYFFLLFTYYMQNRCKNKSKIST
jgi:hypothetical protein